MALRTTRPIGRYRNTRFGGGSRGSQFAGKGAADFSGLNKLEKAVAGPELELLLRETIGDPVYERSQDLVHVRTGELKRSGRVVTSSANGKAELLVEYTANHAAPEEFGANGREPHPYLRPAWDEVVTFGDGKRKLADAMGDLLSKITGDK